MKQTQYDMGQHSERMDENITCVSSPVGPTLHGRGQPRVSALCLPPTWPWVACALPLRKSHHQPDLLAAAGLPRHLPMAFGLQLPPAATPTQTGLLAGPSISQLVSPSSTADLTVFCHSPARQIPP